MAINVMIAVGVDSVEAITNRGEYSVEVVKLFLLLLLLLTTKLCSKLREPYRRS